MIFYGVLLKFWRSEKRSIFSHFDKKTIFARENWGSNLVCSIATAHMLLWSNMKKIKDNHSDFIFWSYVFSVARLHAKRNSETLEMSCFLCADGSNCKLVMQSLCATTGVSSKNCFVVFREPISVKAPFWYFRKQFIFGLHFGKSEKYQGNGSHRKSLCIGKAVNDVFQSNAKRILWIEWNPLEKINFFQRGTVKENNQIIRIFKSFWNKWKIEIKWDKCINACFEANRY